jgi:hypothetical protein
MSNSLAARLKKDDVFVDLLFQWLEKDVRYARIFALAAPALGDHLPSFLSYVDATHGGTQPSAAFFPTALLQVLRHYTPKKEATAVTIADWDKAIADANVYLTVRKAQYVQNRCKRKSEALGEQ